MISVAITIFVVLLIIGFIWRIGIISEKDFSKKIINKFVMKYIILSMLIAGIMFIIISYLISVFFQEIGKDMIIASVLFNFVFILWTFIYERINVYYNISKDKIIEGFILCLLKDKISDIRYSEIIVWFSRWNHDNFKAKINDEKDADRLITKLELLLRPDEKGLCLAAYHKSDFLKLCSRLKNNAFESNLKDIESTASEMEQKPCEKYRLLSLSLDSNILFYLSIIGIHFIAAALVSGKNACNAIGNLLFYLPSDLLLIFVYKGIIKEREEK